MFCRVINVHQTKLPRPLVRWRFRWGACETVGGTHVFIPSQVNVVPVELRVFYNHDSPSSVIEQNILPRTGNAILEESAALREKFPFGGLLPAASELCRALEVFQVYRHCLFVSWMKITCYGY